MTSLLSGSHDCINGAGNLSFTATAETILLRDQIALHNKDCSNAVVLEFPASVLNSNLATDLSFDADDDTWKGTGTTYTETNGNDYNLKMPFSQFKTHYNTAGAGADVYNSEIQSFFTDFEDSIKTKFLINGGEVLYTDETLDGETFDDAALIHLMKQSYPNPAATNLGDSNDKTDTPAGVSEGQTGSTTISFTDSNQLKILGVNQILRRMVDTGYNSRAASGSGTMTGSGTDGLINSNPFIVGDIIYVQNGFTLGANVTISAEFDDSTEQEVDVSGTGTNSLAISVASQVYSASKTSDLFIVLV